MVKAPALRVAGLVSALAAATAPAADAQVLAKPMIRTPATDKVQLQAELARWPTKQECANLLQTFAELPDGAVKTSLAEKYKLCLQGRFKPDTPKVLDTSFAKARPVSIDRLTPARAAAMTR